MADQHQQTTISKTFPVKPKLKPKTRTPSKTPESKYWSSFKSHQIQNLISSIPSITFSPVSSSHLFAATNSASLTLFSSQTFSPTSTISSFSDVVSSCSFRCDKSLFVASDLSGLVQVFDVKTQTRLRRLKSHTCLAPFFKYPVLDKLRLVSSSDDAVVKYWDVAGESKKSVIEVNHGNPIEDVMFMPFGGMIATAGGNSVKKIWDLIGGGKMVYSMESHNKTVTSICVGKIMAKENGEEKEAQLGL